MPPPAHDPATLAAFQDGEQRLLFARYRDQPQAAPYYLEDGSADQVRDWARTHLECFLPDCTDRWLTTVARSRGRDGFRHRGGAGRHEPEGLFHQQAKALLLRWASRVLPDVTAEAEQRTNAGERRADVLLTWPGRQVALEVQYAPLTVEDWRRRHQSYRDAGVVDVWLFGHLRPHLRAATTPAFVHGRDVASVAAHQLATVQLTAVHRAVLDAGLPLLWINPVLERIGYAWEHAGPRHFPYAGRDPWEDLILELPARADPDRDLHRDRVLFGAESLDLFTLGASARLVSPHTAGLYANLDRVARIEQDRESRHADALERRERAARATAERDAQRRADAARRAADRAAREQEHARRWAAQLPVWRAAWETSTLHRQVCARYQGLPAAVTVRMGPVEGLLADPEHWHAVIHQDVLVARAGQDVGINDIYRALRARGIHFETRWPTLVRDTVTAYLRALEAAGHLRPIPDSARSSSGNYRVIGDATAVTAYLAHEQAQQQERRAQAHAEAQSRQQAQRRHHERERSRVRTAWRAQLQAPAPDPSTYSAEPPPGTVLSSPTTPTAPRTGVPARCRSCGGVLAETLAAAGRHIMC